MHSEFKGYYFDGVSPRKQEVTVKVTDFNLIIEGEDRTYWQFDAIKQTQGFYDDEPVKFELIDKSSHASLILTDRNIINTIISISPENKKIFHQTSSLRQKAKYVLPGLIISSIILFAIVKWVVPASSEQIAKFVSPDFEAKLGGSIMKQFEKKGTCDVEETREALMTIVNILNEQTDEHPYEFKIYIINMPIENAFAAPGGHIAVTTGLLNNAESYEEVAGILAHEMAHVLKRHTTKNLIDQYATSMMLSLIFGDLTLFRDIVHQLSTLSYGRELEEEADVIGLGLLSKAKINHQGLSSFFERMMEKNKATDEDGDEENDDDFEIFKYLSTHPETVARINNLKELSKDFDYEPIVLFTDEEWKKKTKICASLAARKSDSACSAIEQADSSYVSNTTDDNSKKKEEL